MNDNLDPTESNLQNYGEIDLEGQEKEVMTF